MSKARGKECLLVVLRENVRNFNYEEMQRGGERGLDAVNFVKHDNPLVTWDWLTLPVVQDVISWCVQAVEDCGPSSVFPLAPRHSLPSRVK